MRASIEIRGDRCLLISQPLCQYDIMINTEQCIHQALQEVRVLIESALAAVGESPALDSDFSHSSGLKDGAIIVEDYLEHNELGLALDHLIYMILAAELQISLTTFQLIEQAVQAMRIDSKLVEKVRDCVRL